MKKCSKRLLTLLLAATMVAASCPAYADEIPVEEAMEIQTETEIADTEVVESETAETETVAVAEAEENWETVLVTSSTTAMFNPIEASLMNHEGSLTLRMVLSGTGYKEMMLGTYEDALEYGLGLDDVNGEKWIHGYQNANKKYEFMIPVSEEMLDGRTIPVVSISNAKLTNYLNGTGTLENISIQDRSGLTLKKVLWWQVIWI